MRRNRKHTINTLSIPAILISILSSLSGHNSLPIQPTHQIVKKNEEREVDFDFSLTSLFNYDFNQK